MRSETIPSSRITPDLQIHSFFSSVHLIHLLQGSDQRTPDTRSETIPSSRITPDLQIHSFFSSVHSLIFYRVQIREHLTRDQRPFLPPESLQIFRFTASSLQFTHSSSTGFRTENTWPEIRDHSFIQNHSRSSDSQLLLFSSLTHLLQGSDQRTPDTRSETIPSSRITPDRQIHSFFSSVHSLIFYRVQIREHLTRDQRPFLHPESLQIFRFTASSLQFTSLIFYRVQIREHLTQDQRPFLHPESLQIFRFTASPLQFTHSSSTGFRSENTWHEIRDHSFIQNHSRSSDSQLLLFSSPHSSSTGFRSENTWHEIRDHSFIQNHSRSSDSQLLLFSSPHSSSTGFRSENTWHEIRDHSFIQNHSRSSDSQLLLFSSLTHLLQASDQRTPDTRSETFIHNHSRSSDSQLLLFSSPHSSSTGFRSENTWHEIRDHSFIQNHSRSSDSRLLLFSSPHSSSTGFRSENTWHEIRDHSFIQNHSRSSDSQLLLFSSLTHLLQGSGQRTPDTRSETIPSSRITPDLQIHSFSSSVHSLIFYRVQIREHLTRDQRAFLHPESLQIFRFTASSLQFTHSSSTGFRSENTWHEIRDHSFIQNHSRSSDSQLLLFSSLTHLLQGSDQRTPDTRSETIPSSRITPDLQIHSFSSSVHSSSTGFRSENTWHEIRDHSFIQNHSRSSDSQLLLFSSPHTSSTGFRLENTWHEIRDHSFIQNHSRSSDSQLLLFSSPHSSSTGFRSENTWHEIRDHSFIQNHSRSSDSQLLLFSSPHSSSTGFRSENTWHEIRDNSFIQNHSRSSDSQLLLFSSPHSSSTGFRSENTWHEIRDHSFIQNHSKSSDSQLLLFSSPHSSSTGFRSENTWHEIRDHSFIQNHSRSSDSQLLLFSSLTHLLQGSDQRTPDTRSETIPSSRITPDLQIHSFFSSVHSLIFYRVQNREHLTRDQRPFLHPESLQIFRFTASSLQFTHSSSTGFRSENTWHEIRDHSFIQNHSRSSDSQLLLFSSPHSSSTGFRSENTWHEIRDHSFIQNHSRSSDSQLLLFSSLTHLLQGSDQRTPDTRSETIPSSRITPDPSDSQLLLFSSLTHLLQGSGQRTPDTRSETIPSSRITPDLQIHSFFSSVHSLIFYRVQVRGLEWPAEAWFCAQWHMFVLFLRFVFGLLYGWKIQTWPIIRFLTESVNYRLFVICWYLI